MQKVFINPVDQLKKYYFLNKFRLINIKLNISWEQCNLSYMDIVHEVKLFFRKSKSAACVKCDSLKIFIEERNSELDPN